MSSPRRPLVFVAALVISTFRSEARSSYADLVRLHPQLLDSKIMLTRYSADVLFSPAARQAFVEPNVQGIPPR